MEDRTFDQRGALGPFLVRILRHAWRHRPEMIGFMFWVGIVGVADAGFPLVVLDLIDRVLTPEIARWANGEELSAPVGRLLLPHGLAFLGLGVLQVVGVWFFIRHAGRVQEFVLFDLRREMFAKLQRLQSAFFDKHASGWLLTRLTSDGDRVTELISWGLVDLVWGLVMIVACLGALFFYQWKLALIVTLSLPVLFLISVRVRMLVLRWSRRSRKLNSDITAAFTEHIGGVAVVKSTAQEERAGAEFRGLSGRMRHASFRAAWYTALYMPLVIFTGSVAAGLVVVFGGTMAAAVPAGITVGVLAASFEYATRIFMPILDISHFYALAQGSLSAGERIFSLLDEEITVDDAEGASDHLRFRGEIRFEDVHFAYEPDKPVLNGIDLVIPAGQSVALVGPTGEGKSTFVRLIGRYYDVTSGRITIDGADLRDRTIASLRGQMGVVLQSPHLFSGTVRDNVRFGKPDATEEEVRYALDVLGADELIARLDEEVGEGGSRLSEGERQLVSFARAVIADPTIFVMDEATSSVDALAEERIQRGVRHIIRDRTSVIIAHRLSTIRHCDRILVIGGGRIVEDGTHEELLAMRGAYWALHTGAEAVAVG